MAGARTSDHRTLRVFHATPVARNSSTLLGAIAAAASLASCLALGTAGVPFAVPADSLAWIYKTIAVAPVHTPSELDIPGDAAADLEAAIEENLRQMGYRIVAAFEYQGIWQHIADDLGGFYDPYTGERDEELFGVATDRLRSELRARFQVDAVLYPELWDGTVLFFDGLARWDGAAQEVFGARGMNGEVRALTLVVSIEDLSGTELYSNGFGFSTIEAWHNNEWLPLVLEGVVGDPRLVSTAVENVLAPLADARAGIADQSR